MNAQTRMISAKKVKSEQETSNLYYHIRREFLKSSLLAFPLLENLTRVHMNITEKDLNQIQEIMRLDNISDKNIVKESILQLINNASNLEQISILKEFTKLAEFFLRTERHTNIFAKFAHFITMHKEGDTRTWIAINNALQDKETQLSMARPGMKRNN